MGDNKDVVKCLRRGDRNWEMTNWETLDQGWGEKNWWVTEKWRPCCGEIGVVVSQS